MGTKTGIIIDLIWIIVMFLGIGIGRYTGEITSGEFYISLILLVFTSRMMLMTYSKGD